MGLAHLYRHKPCAAHMRLVHASLTVCCMHGIGACLQASAKTAQRELVARQQEMGGELEVARAALVEARAKAEEGSAAAQTLERVRKGDMPRLGPAWLNTCMFSAHCLHMDAQLGRWLVVLPFVVGKAGSDQVVREVGCCGVLVINIVLCLSLCG